MMRVAHGCPNAMTQTRGAAFGTGYPPDISDGPRIGTSGSGHISAGLAVATSDYQPSDHAFTATPVWHGRNLEGYLGRKLHRQWRSRGS